ncbi:pilus assembly protein [Phyllobacterium sp. 628]|uniref:TadE/TadG family type IV pilus assembly protein n=1 Tax=Phyllobacterium sp. 628 TaxID=2718938 RepID=UPI0016623656|nr:TadE/TadG family type IV pilus assembly protein [Phyllobacterium sp. 628]QND51775.1 pilus assembly protein [Phyllobacterium sp. 628]
MTATHRAGTYLANFLADRRGVAAMEFALIAPVMIMLLLGSVEITTGLDVNKKLGRATIIVNDLVTQQQAIVKNDLDDIMAIGATTLLPYQRDLPQITVTAINIPLTGSPTVAWSRRMVNQTVSTPYTKGSNITVDANLNNPGTSIVRVETQIAYIPLIAWTIKNTVNTSVGTSGPGLAMSKTYYGRVRQGPSVACSDC